MRLRRSTEQMISDPISLYIVSNDKKEAEGQIYIDDYKTFNYVIKNESCLKKIKLSNNIISSLPENDCKYTSSEYIERIEILNYDKPSSTFFYKI